jgi:hypothetical protein
MDVVEVRKKKKNLRSRLFWTVKPVLKIKESGKIYDRKKKGGYDTIK